MEQARPRTSRPTVPPAPHWREKPDRGFCATLGSLRLEVAPMQDGRCARFVILLPSNGGSHLLASGTRSDIGPAMQAAVHTAARLQQLVDGWLRLPAKGDRAQRQARPRAASTTRRACRDLERAAPARPEPPR